MKRFVWVIEHRDKFKPEWEPAFFVYGDHPLILAGFRKRSEAVETLKRERAVAANADIGARLQFRMKKYSLTRIGAKA